MSEPTPPPTVLPPQPQAAPRAASLLSNAHKNSGSERANPALSANVTDDEQTDEVLFVAYGNGDERAFIELHRRHRDRVTALLRRHAAPNDVADLVQQTFLQLHRARRDYRAGEPLAPWLNTIALNLARDSARRRRTRQRHQPADAPTPQPVAPDAALDQAQTRARVQQAVDALSPKDKEVVVLHWYQELPFAEIATRMSVSLSAAKVRAHRAYARLRADLHDEEDR